jgi:hypothetical protein
VQPFIWTVWESLLEFKCPLKTWTNLQWKKSFIYKACGRVLFSLHGVKIHQQTHWRWKLCKEKLKEFLITNPAKQKILKALSHIEEHTWMSQKDSRKNKPF